MHKCQSRSAKTEVHAQCIAVKGVVELIREMIQTTAGGTNHSDGGVTVGVVVADGIYFNLKMGTY